MTLETEKNFIINTYETQEVEYGLNILLSNGMVKNTKDITLNEYIMNTSGKPNKVTKIIKNKTNLYSVTQTKGDNYIVPGNHILILKASNVESVARSKNIYQVNWLEIDGLKSKKFKISDYNSDNEAYEIAKEFLYKEVPLKVNYVKYKDIVEMSLDNFIKMPKSYHRRYNGFCVGLNFDNKIKLPIDPYALGQWIGDGTSSNSGITTADKEIVEYFTEYANTLGLEFKEHRKYHYSLTTGVIFGPKGSNKFLTFLQEFNLINNKHIPDIYKFSSRENRLKLLAGLIDSDGSNSGTNYDFIFKSEKITDDTIYLARSLGYRANKKNCKKTCTNALNGPKEGSYFRFSICGNSFYEIPVLLHRKKINKKKNLDATIVGISINEIGIHNYYSIETEEQNSQILLQDYTVAKL